MRLHRNLVLAVIKVLDGVFNQDLYADKTIEKILKQDKRWGSRDKALARLEESSNYNALVF